MDSGDTQKFYTRKASFYHRLFIDFLGWGRKLERFFRESEYLRPDLKILDAGCGTGIVTRILYSIVHQKKYESITFHAFDITPAMLEIFQEWIVNKRAKDIVLQQADVLSLEQLPLGWKAYDLIISSAMLEYLPKEKIRQALSSLKSLLNKDGRMLVFITRRNIITKLLVELWWKANIYDEEGIRQIFQDVGFNSFRFVSFAKMWFNSTIVVEAR